jgi:DNA-binding NtrC family response regulator
MEALATAGRGRVLLVDDDDSVRHSASAFLDDEFHVHAAPGVSEALAIIDVEPIDVLVTDFLMGDGTGEQVIRRARAAAGRAVFTIVVTGWPCDPRVSELGAAEHVIVLCKPVAPEVLIDCVRRGLAVAQLLAVGE